jgi:hypothetical protein
MESNLAMATIVDNTNDICVICTYPQSRCQCEHIISNGCKCDQECDKCYKAKLLCNCTKTATYETYERDMEDTYEYDSEGEKYSVPSYVMNYDEKTFEINPKVVCAMCNTKTVCESNYGYCNHKCSCFAICAGCERSYYSCVCEGMNINGDCDRCRQSYNSCACQRMCIDKDDNRDHSKEMASLEILDSINNIIVTATDTKNKQSAIFFQTNITTCAYLQLHFVRNYMNNYANSPLCKTTIGKISHWKNRFSMVLSGVNSSVPDEIINLIFTYLKDDFYDDCMVAAFYNYGYVPFGRSLNEHTGVIDYYTPSNYYDDYDNY